MPRSWFTLKRHLVSFVLTGSVLLDLPAGSVDAAGARAVQPATIQPVVSDVHSGIFSVSWVTPSPTAGRVDVKIGGKWISIPDVRGTIKSTVHLFTAPCAGNAKCTQQLQPNTSYPVRVYTTGSSYVSLTARTSSVITPGTPLAAVAGHILDGKKKPLSALIYLVVHHGSTASYPLASLTIDNGGWVVSLGNAVTKAGKAFPVSLGDQVDITVRSAAGNFTRHIHLKNTESVIVLSPIVLK